MCSPATCCLPPVFCPNRLSRASLGGQPLSAHDCVWGRYVSTRERKFNPIPKVMYVRLFGIDIETGEHRHEDYYP